MRVVTALLLLCIPFAFAQSTAQPSRAQLAANDVAVLQYALLLERLEAFFYNTFQAQYSAQDFVAAGLTAQDYSYFDLIRNHENAHVRFLESTGIPSPTNGNCTYDFSSVTDIQSYLRVAAILENTGVSAYDGAINRIYNKDTQQAAATIATVEARHAAYLNNITGRIPFPNVTDIALEPTTVSDVVFGPGGYANCPFVPGFLLPVVYTVQPIANASDPSQPTPQSLTSNDILVLQYALFLEHLEANFYNYVVQTFGSAFGSEQVSQYIELIRQHENSHVATLSSVITSLGGTPGPACASYNFSGSVTDVPSALSTAAALENTGVYAYDGAVKFIYDNALKQAAATIATVEARHASYLNALTGFEGNQGPVRGGAETDDGAYDLALDFQTVVNAVLDSTLLGDCSVALQSVQPFRLLVVQPYTNPTTSTPTSAPTTSTPSPTTGTAAPTTGTAAPTTGTVGPSRAPTAAPITTARVTTTSGASIASASVVVALLVAMAAF